MSVTKLPKKSSSPKGRRKKESLSVTISRVLYWAIIYPGHLLPDGSSDRGKCGEQPTIPASCTGWGLQQGYVTISLGELLPRLSILTEESKPLSGFFLLHSPWSRLRRPLAGTLALRCPDFPHTPYGARDRLFTSRTRLFYFYGKEFVNGNFSAIHPLLG